METVGLKSNFGLSDELEVKVHCLAKASLVKSEEKV